MTPDGKLRGFSRATPVTPARPGQLDESTEVIYWRPSTMFSDHDNPSTAAAAAPAQDSEKEAPKTVNETPSSASETGGTVNAAKEEATAAPVAQADGDPRPEQATAPAAPVAADGTSTHAPEAHSETSQGAGPGDASQSGAAPVDAEAAAAAEEAAGSEEM